MAEKKELTVEAEDLAKYQAVKIVEEPVVVEDKGETLIEKEATVAPEVIESGIGIGMVTGFKNGASAGIAGEKDHRSNTIQSKSQES